MSIFQSKLYQVWQLWSQKCSEDKNLESLALSCFALTFIIYQSGVSDKFHRSTLLNRGSRPKEKWRRRGERKEIFLFSVLLQWSQPVSCGRRDYENLSARPCSTFTRKEIFLFPVLLQWSQPVSCGRHDYENLSARPYSTFTRNWEPLQRRVPQKEVEDWISNERYRRQLQYKCHWKWSQLLVYPFRNYTSCINNIPIRV